jgi:putative flippase GtrA
MFKKFLSIIRRESKMLIRYVFVGGSSFGVKVGVYAALSRLLWIDGPRSLQNIIALLIAMVYNYSLHRFWTFKHQEPAPGSAPRYVAVVIIGSTLDASLFYLGHDILKFYDFFVLIANAGFTTILSFTLHKFFTFHNNPWKKNKRAVGNDEIRLPAGRQE